jgi:hypothetical protein
MTRNGMSFGVMDSPLAFSEWSQMSGIVINAGP